MMDDEYDIDSALAEIEHRLSKRTDSTVDTDIIATLIPFVRTLVAMIGQQQEELQFLREKVDAVAESVDSLEYGCDDSVIE